MHNSLIILEAASEDNVSLLVGWTVDPIAQGRYKRVPEMSEDALQDLFLNSSDRHYFLIRRTADGKPLGRFYWRAWHFQADKIDWELNVFIADPAERGKGYGTAAQVLAVAQLLALPETNSVFAYTMHDNTAERRALSKAGFSEAGLMPHEYYRVNLPREECVLYVAHAVVASRV